MGPFKLCFDVNFREREREREPSTKGVGKGLFTTYNHTMFMKPQGEIVHQENRDYLNTQKGKGMGG